MTDVWFAAFGLLGLLTVMNSILLVAMMRQVGVLHQRLPSFGPGAVGPEPGKYFEPLAFSPVAGARTDGFGDAAIRVLAYITPGCHVCAPIPGFLETYLAGMPGAFRPRVSAALITDAPEPEASAYRDTNELDLPFVRHAYLRDHYELTEVGAPYVLVLTDRLDGGGSEQELLLAGGIVNTLEQLEDLMEISRERYAAYSENPEIVDKGELNGDVPEEERSALEVRKTTVGG